MTGARLALTLTVLLAGVAMADAATCSSPTGLAALRAEAASQCPCNVTRSEYRRCNRDFMRAKRPASSLSNACWHDFRSAVSRSTCGRPDRVACCIPAANGERKCKIATPAQCVRKAGCESAWTSCADACTTTGCAAPPTTTTTTTLPSLCGNGVIDGAEQCDGGAFCSASCHIVELACCQPNSCTALDTTFADPGTVLYQCRFTPGSFAAWGYLSGPDPDCPGSSNNERCDRVTAPAPVTVCCSGPTAGCAQMTTDDGPTLMQFTQFDCPLADRAHEIEGTCGADGSCTPSH